MLQSSYVLKIQGVSLCVCPKETTPFAFKEMRPFAAFKEMSPFVPFKETTPFAPLKEMT